MSAPFSGSVLAPPSSVTVARSSTVWSAPASAVGASSSAVTVTSTVSAAETEVVPAAVTVSEKVRAAVVLRSGAVKVGAEGRPVRRTVVPAVWLQEYTRGRFPGSVLAPPSSVTVAPSATVWSEPAFAVGASPFTVTFTASAAES